MQMPRKPNEVQLTDSKEYPWLMKTVSAKDIQSWPGLFPRLDTYRFGEDRGKGALVVIQPVMEAWHYRNQEEFASVLNAWFTQADEAGLFDSQTIVVLPEYLGLYLYLADEFPWVTRAKTLDAAAALSLLDEKALLLFKAVLGAWDRPYPDAVKAELMTRKAARAAEIYQTVLGGLARQFRVTLVGGSIPLPGAFVAEDGLTLRTGAHALRDMQNVCPVWRPDGTLEPKLTVKRHPTRDEGAKLWLKPGEGGPGLYDTPAGKLAVMICADAWHPDIWKEAAEADLVAVPAMSLGSGQWPLPWVGYDHMEEITGLPEPKGETLGEAWAKHALLGRIGGSQARAGVVSFFRGTVFDQATSGVPQFFLKGEALRLPASIKSPMAVRVNL